MHIDSSSDVIDVHANINDNNPEKVLKILIVFDGMIAEMVNNSYWIIYL